MNLFFAHVLHVNKGSAFIPRCSHLYNDSLGAGINLVFRYLACVVLSSESILAKQSSQYIVFPPQPKRHISGGGGRCTYDVELINFIIGCQFFIFSFFLQIHNSTSSVRNQGFFDLISSIYLLYIICIYFCKVGVGGG